MFGQLFGFDDLRKDEAQPEAPLFAFG